MPPRLTGTLEKLTTDLQARPSFVRSTDKSVLLIFSKKKRFLSSASTPPHSRAARSRNALAMTDTELNDIASAATTGLSTIPKLG